MIKNLLDHLFFRIYWWNKKILKDSTPIYMAFLGTLFFLIINFNTILFVVSVILVGNTASISKGYYFFTLFTAIIINFTYFGFQRRYKYLSEEYIRKLSSISKRERDIVIIIYIVVSFALYILAMYQVVDNR